MGLLQKVCQWNQLFAQYGKFAVEIGHGSSSRWTPVDAIHTHESVVNTVRESLLQLITRY